MEPHVRDELARLRWEAKHHRECAARLRKARRIAKERRDPIGALKAFCAANERSAAARQCDLRIAELRGAQ